MEVHIGKGNKNLKMKVVMFPSNWTIRRWTEKEEASAIL